MAECKHDRPVSVLEGQCALVTGAAKRLGHAVSLALARSGVNIVAHYHSSEAEARALVGELTAAGVRAWAVKADLEDPEQAQNLTQKAAELAGPIDILVNNASIFPPGALVDLDATDVYRNIQINALSPFQISRAFARQVRRGSIVNMLDAKIVQYDAKHAAYHLSKRMLFTLTRMMAFEFAPDVRVNGVAPGLILPPPGEDESYLERFASHNPLKRWGSIDQIADAVLFLLRSDFVTGQVIFVDGGQHMKGAMYG